MCQPRCAKENLRKKGQCNDFHVSSYSQHIRKETTGGGNNITKGGGDHFRPVYFINLLADPIFSDLMGRSSLAGPCTTKRFRHWKSGSQEERNSRKDVRGQNEGYKRRNLYESGPIVKKGLLWLMTKILDVGHLDLYLSSQAVHRHNHRVEPNSTTSINQCFSLPFGW